MRAYELTEQSKIYYHASLTELPIGTILTPRSDYESIWRIADFYYPLEEYRPKNMLSHKESVFMGETEEDAELGAGGAEWIFTVKPLGKVEKHDLNWGSEISMLIGDGYKKESKEVATAARNYWSGVPHPNESVWEYLTPKAEILSVESF